MERDVNKVKQRRSPTAEGAVVVVAVKKKQVEE